MDAELVAFDVGQERRPVQLPGFDARLLDRVPDRQPLEQRLFGCDQIHTVDDLEDPQLIQREDNVLCHDGRFLGNVHDAQPRFVRLVQQKIQYCRGPVRLVGLLTEVGHWFFGAPYLLFLLGELVRETNDEAAVPLPLVGWEGQDASQVVPDVTVLFLAEVSHGVKSPVVHFAHDIKQEWVHVEVKRLVIQEEFRYVAQVLAVNLLFQSINLEHGQIAAAVDLVAGRMTLGRFQPSLEPPKLALAGEQVERKFAHVQNLQESGGTAELLGKR